MEQDFSPTQAAAMLGLSDRSIRRRIKAGRLDATQVQATGGELGYRITLSEIQRYRQDNPNDVQYMPSVGLEGDYADPTLEDDDEADDDDEIVAKATLAQERAMVRATVARRRERALAKTQINYADLIAVVREEFESGPQITVTPPRPTPKNEKPVLTPILLLSDLHDGATYSREKMQGLSSFDHQTFAQRIYRLSEAVQEIIEAQRAFHTINHMVIAWGGDNFEGRTIFEGQDRETRGLLSQFRLSTQVMHEGLLVPLAGLVSKITMKKVPGNHGRLGTKKHPMDGVEDSLDLLWMDYLELRAQNIPNIAWDKEDGSEKLFKLHGWQFLLHHGDKTQGPAHTPTAGARSYRRAYESVAHLKVDVSLSGHLHSAGLSMDGFSTHITNGCVPGGSPYGIGLGYNSPPIQTLITVSDKYPVQGHFPIWLATRDECITTKSDNLDIA